MVAEVAFSFSVLHAEALSFDVAMRLWRLMGRTIAEVGGVNSVSLADEHTAQFKAFALAVKHLSTPTALAALKLAPEAPIVDRFLTKLETESSGRFEPVADPVTQATVSHVRAALSDIVLGDVCEES